MVEVMDDYDVIVVGSGGAGLYAAVSAAENGLNVAVMSKGRVNRSGATQLAGSGIAGDLEADGESLWNMGFKDADKTHTKEVWFKNIVLQGSYLNDQDLTENYVQKAEEVVYNLLSWGMKPYFIYEGVALYFAGVHILDALYKKAKSLDVTSISNRMVTDIVTWNGMVAGVIGIDVYSGEIFYNPAKAVVIATGGCQGMYELNTGTSELTCDGIGMALRAGAEIKNMEMMEFCNDTIVYPRKYMGNILPYILRDLGYGELLNKNGEDFITKYFDSEIVDIALHTEWNKELVSYAEYKEIKDGRGYEEGGVMFTMEGSQKKVFTEFYNIFPMIKHAPMDMEIMHMLEDQEKLYVAPAAHYIAGGIKVDSEYKTNVKGLFAAGECKAGTFGANRVSSALTEMLVEGLLAGRNVSEYIKSMDKFPSVSKSSLEERFEKDLLRPFNISQESKFKSFISIKKDLRKTMWNNVGPIKNETSLTYALNRIEYLLKEFNKVNISDKSREYNPEWIEYLNLRNMLHMAAAVAKSSLIRRESRGVHVREDYFFVDDENWLKNIVIYDMALNYSFEEPVITRINPPRVKMTYLKYIKTLLKGVKGAY